MNLATASLVKVLSTTNSSQHKTTTTLAISQNKFNSNNHPPNNISNRSPNCLLKSPPQSTSCKRRSPSNQQLWCPSSHRNEKFCIQIGQSRQWRIWWTTLPATTTLSMADSTPSLAASKPHSQKSIILVTRCKARGIACLWWAKNTIMKKRQQDAKR